MPPELKAQVSAAADRNNRSMNAEITSRLEWSFAQESSAVGAKLTKDMSGHNAEVMGDLVEALALARMEFRKLLAVDPSGLEPVVQHLVAAETLRLEALVNALDLKLRQALADDA